jgi:hypothetical protein
MWPSARGASVRSQGPWRGASTSEDVRIVFRANATWTSTSVNSVFGAVSRHPSAEVGLRHRTPFHTDDSTKRQAGSRGERKRWWLAIDPLVPCSPLYASSGVPCRRCVEGDVPCRRCVEGDVPCRRCARGWPAGHVQTIMFRGPSIASPCWYTAVIWLYVHVRDPGLFHSSSRCTCRSLTSGYWWTSRAVASCRLDRVRASWSCANEHVSVLVWRPVGLMLDTSTRSCSRHKQLCWRRVHISAQAQLLHSEGEAVSEAGMWLPGQRTVGLSSFGCQGFCHKR